MLTQGILTTFIKKLHQNNKNYITISLKDSEYINIYIFEQLMTFLNQKQSTDTIDYSSYYIYKTGNITLHLNNNGSSMCYSDQLKYNDTIDSNGYRITFSSHYNRKLQNDVFESSYKYDSIDIIESISYVYNSVNIELLKINNKYSIRILVDNDNSHSSIYNLLNIILNLAK
jgi:hypothetical protein